MTEKEVDFIPPDGPVMQGEPSRCPRHFYELDGPCTCQPEVRQCSEHVHFGELHEACLCGRVFFARSGPYYFDPEHEPERTPAVPTPGAGVAPAPCPFVADEACPAVPDVPLATRMFALKRAFGSAEDDTFDAVFTILGCDPRDPATFFFSDWTFDDYDASFELKKVRRKVVLSAEQQAALCALGFMRCWICYADDVPGPFTGNASKREDYYRFPVVEEAPRG